MDGDKPSVVVDYNISMKGTTVGAQMASCNLTTRHSKVWYRKIFFLSDVAMAMPGLPIMP